MPAGTPGKLQLLSAGSQNLLLTELVVFKPTADIVVTDFLIYQEGQALRPRFNSSFSV